MVRSSNFELITGLMKALFEHEEKNLSRRENEVISRHSSLGGSSDGFRHLGFTYTQLSGASRSRGHYDRLHPSLVPVLDEISTERKALENDKDFVKQALAIVLRDCQSLQDIRDALPNSLKDFVPDIARLERTRPEAYTLAENERSYTQYMKLREKIEFYTATRLLY